MSQRVRILTMPVEHFGLLLRGEARVVNLPADGQIVAASHMGSILGFRVHSDSYPPADGRAQIPISVAVIERLRGEES